MRHATNSVTSVFNSWSYLVKLSLPPPPPPLSRARTPLVYYPSRSTFTYYRKPCHLRQSPCVDARAEKADEVHRHKTEVKTRERRRESCNIWYGLSRFRTVPFRSFGLFLFFSLSRSPPLSPRYPVLFLSLGSSRLCRHSRSGRCRCPDVTSVTMSFNTRR